MVKNIQRKLTNALRIFLLFADYYIYLILSPFKFTKIKYENIKNILIIDLLKIGDLIVTTPVITALKERFPSSKIYFLVEKGYKKVLEDNKKLQEVLEFDGRIKETIKEIKKRNIDTALILHPGSLKISIILLLSGVKYRVGCAHPKGLLSPKGFFLTRKVMPNTKVNHAIEDNLAVSKLIGAYPSQIKLEIFYDRKSDKKAKQILKDLNIKQNDLKIIIHPGSNYKDHEWDKDKWNQVAKTLTVDLKAKVLITGSKDDITKAREIKKDLKNVYIVAGKNSIKETYAIADKADLILSVDTAMMHIAAALDKKIVALFLGIGYPEKWYPYTKNRVVLVESNISKEITPDQVINSVKILLKR